LTNALKDLYPVVTKIVGDVFFMECARRYIAVAPSQSGDLNDFGGAFASFLRSYPYASELPYLPDVADIEWSWHRAFHAADGQRLDLQQLCAVPTAQLGDLTLTLDPSVTLLRSAYPIFQIWQVNQFDYVGSLNIDWASNGEQLIVFRKDFDVTVEKIDAARYAMLVSLQSENTIEAAIAATFAQHGECNFQAFLLWCVQNGILNCFDEHV
jgi:hypothetical protein